MLMRLAEEIAFQTSLPLVDSPRLNRRARHAAVEPYLF